MPKSTNDKKHLRSFSNLLGYFKRKNALQNISGTIGAGKDDIIFFDGREMTWKDFDYLFPDKKLIPASTQLDGRAVET